MKRKSLNIILAFALILVVISGFAHTWQTVVSPMGDGAVGVSADGRIICAIQPGHRPIISTNYGSTWATNQTNPVGDGNVGSIAVSGDGSRMFASFFTNEIFVSTDQGATWVQTAFPSSGSATLACTADGMRVVAAISAAGIYYSTNGGVSCYTSSAPVAAWSAIASSADGSQMLAARSSGPVYFSSDFGATWTVANLAPQFWNSVCVSADGKWVGVASVGDAFISNDSGASWQTNHLLGGRGIACSANGSCWVISGSQVFTSTNSGFTWQTNMATSIWEGNAVSADGCEMIATGGGLQGMAIGRLTPSPQLNIQSQDTNVAISWLIPSTNFILQQSADISNPSWSNVSTNPTLNLTNLNQQVSVPASGGNAFFRLATP